MYTNVILKSRGHVVNWDFPDYWSIEDIMKKRRIEYRPNSVQLNGLYVIPGWAEEISDPSDTWLCAPIKELVGFNPKRNVITFEEKRARKNGGKRDE